MQAQQLLHKTLENVCPNMHKVRRSSLEAVVQAAMSGAGLTVTRLGRAIESPAKEKHCIKRSDRLLSNPHFQQECFGLYQSVSRLILGNSQQPVILVDWSDLDGSGTHFLLRASTPAGGRSLTLYEEVHTVETKEKPKTHRRFLNRLGELLPEDCRPILVTDAGFRTPWFKQVEACGWDWVGRVRNRHLVQLTGKNTWEDCKSLYVKASATPRLIGGVCLTRANPFDCQLVLYKGPRKGRKCLTRFGLPAHCQHNNKHANREREPWLLATSLPVTSKLAKRAVKCYATRMQIEESFRDIKSSQYGLGFEYSRTYTTERLAALLLIGHLALLVIWILGKATELTGQARQYQANTVQDRRVLSTIFIGLKVINDARVTLLRIHIKRAISNLINTIKLYSYE